ncbi:DUF87 domain-containing protein [Candidatus Woesearchaeota archaeon]|nr:DUF87 domain-containing protein [Candidatus Woesearchaeota archaeon]
MKHKKTRRKHRIDLILNKILLVLVVITAVLSMLMLREFIGFLSYHAAEGGVITELRVDRTQPPWAWNGIYGLVFAFSGLNNTWIVETTNAGMDPLTMIVDCLEPEIEHEVYALNAPPAQINWENVTAADPSLIDNFTGVDPGNAMAAVNTFIYNMSISLGNTTISDIPMAYTYQNDAFGTDFMHGLLTDGEHIIIVSKVTDDYPQGFDGNNYNYQMFVPVPANSSVLYYLVTDPFDVCPEGAEETFGKGTVYGWASDNTTGLPLENVDVYIGTEHAVTDADGYYNLSVTRGDYLVVALKYGYNNYISNVSVTENNATLHNITMEMYEEPQEGTGTGVGTGVGPGTTDKTRTGKGPGVGPGIGPSIGPYMERPEEPGIDHFITLDRLYKRLRIGNFFVENIVIYSFRTEAVKVYVSIKGNASKVIEIDKTSFTIEPNSYENVTVTGFGRELGTYIGSFEVSGDLNDSLPIQIIVTDEEKLPVEALLIQLELLTKKPFAGDRFKFRLNLHNMLIEEQYNVSLYYSVRGIEADTANYSMEAGTDNVELLTALSLIKEFTIPKEWPKGEYLLIIDADYLDLYSQSSTVFEIYEPIYMYRVFGKIELWKILLGLIILSLIIFTVIIIRAKIEAKKRFHAKVEYNLLPKKGSRSLYVGKIAETENDTYFDMDSLTVHTIVAGSTGGGKTISGQDIVEECLMKNVAVVVFDPTAQWTGMLRKCQDVKMMSFYPRFHLTKKNARAFNGNVRAIKNPREKIDLMKYWKAGEINIFTLSTLDPKDIDVFVANTVREVFHCNLQEYRGLRMLMVYDEVHRLLPKFGGSGEGFIQIERACREFRKWGIGVLLISQVLADFVGQIKANINTEVQMKTRDEGDLKRIETKYGASYVQELVKSPVGSGMVQNSAWNRGKPYYITFRPILHSVKRLTDEELAQYNKYNEMVDDLTYQVDQLEKEGQDVFDLRLELKLSLDKIKSGNFNMVDIYLEGLKPRLEKVWKELGKTPKKREVELISEDEIKADLEAAKNAREKYEKETGGGEKKKEEKGPLGYSDDVPPNKLLKLVNGMLVINMKSLYDEIAAMKEADFKQHVNEEKNDFSDWIRNAVGNAKLADVADKIITKDDFLAFLDACGKKQGEKFKPTQPRENIPKKEGGKAGEQQKEGEKKEEPPKQDQKSAEGEQQPQKPEENKQGEQQNKNPPENKEEPKPDETNKQPEAQKDNEKTQRPAQNTTLSPDQYFKLSDGRVIKSLQELHDSLANMDDNLFKTHVTDQKNDFSSWIKSVFHDQELSDKLATIKSKEEIMKILDEKLKTAKGVN